MTKVKCYVSVQVTYLLDIINGDRILIGRMRRIKRSFGRR